ncbi:thiol:disulfide interchange protein DsbD [Prevotellaceae bacterium HUN156]|nr:thiol:disulfide interchange protein DsbD [Prevotellaceae bacterium HUN156]
MKRLMITLWVALFALVAQGQMVDPVHFTSQMKMLKDGEAEIVFSATIDNGWHVYSTDMGNDGPISASFNVVKMEGAEKVGKLKPRGNVIKQYDKMFGMELRFFEKKAEFVQRIRFTKPKYTIDCYLEFGACNDEMCLPPTEVAFKKEGDASSNLPLKGEAKDATEEAPSNLPPLGEDKDTSMVQQTDTVGSAAVDAWWAPVDDIQNNDGNDLSNRSLLYILLMGFVGGLLAVMMPCIWPIIPMTVSFFLKRAKTDRKKGLRDALTYGLSIVVIYLTLGLLVTAIFGSDTLNAMSTNSVFNVFLFLLLVVFALSFFGWFEIKLPSGWANAVDNKASATSGYLSIFLMAFTLVLVSFSCTAPIIGLLLVEAATSNGWLAPAVGMLGFAVALALPFTLFALFPSWLQQAPKSGSWMNTLKVVLGFVELAFALKFLSVADLAYGWHILDREVFLSLWIVIFGLLGAYLCGWLKFRSDEIGGELNRPMPVACIMGGIASLAFAVYMIPGLWGAPCKAVSAFAPPMNTQDFNLNNKVVEARFRDYDEGMEVAKREGKPVIVDFTGFGCVNCRKMEAAVWTDPRVADLLTKDYVLISLYVDDKTPLAEPIEVKDAQGNTKTLRTVGAKWSYLQSHKFGTNAQPYYVLLDNEGQLLMPGRGYNEDVAAYVDFLQEGARKVTSDK